MSVASNELHGDALVGGALSGHVQHILGGVDGGDSGSATRQHQGGASGARADVEDPPIVEAPDHVRHDARLRAGNQLADRPAEAAVLERLRHRRIGVHRIAVMVGLPGHARSSMPATVDRGGEIWNRIRV